LAKQSQWRSLTGFVQILSERNRLWVLKKSFNGTPFHLRACVAGFLDSIRLSGGRQNRCCPLTEEAHQYLAARKNCSRTNFNLRRAPQSDLILVCFGELRRVNQLPRTLSGWFVLVDDEGSTLR